MERMQVRKTVTSKELTMLGISQSENSQMKKGQKKVRKNVSPANSGHVYSTILCSKEVVSLALPSLSSVHGSNLLTVPSHCLEADSI